MSADATPLPTHPDEPHAGSIAGRLNWLRAGVLACCALGAIGLALSGRLSPRPALRVLDVSASMGSGARGPAGAFQAPGERLLFADGVRWAARGDEAGDVPRGRTRLAQALTEAATRFPRGPGRVWLVTDGRDTEGGAFVGEIVDPLPVVRDGDRLRLATSHDGRPPPG